jgi:predicted AAA+ superfamily ATPase
VKNYLGYAEKTFILKKISPFFKNIRKEITKSPVIYFYDLGLRNYALGLFGNLINSSEIGHIFQNFILNLIKERLELSAGEIHFWRTKDRAEVDFVIQAGRELIPIEAKFKQMKRPSIPQSLKNFISKYQPKEAWVVNLRLKEKVRLAHTEIHFLPFYELIFRRIQPGACLET